MFTFYFGLGLSVCAEAWAEGNGWQENFSHSKEKLLKIYFSLINENSLGPRTFYCSCSFNQYKKIDHSSCGYQPRNPAGSRASVLEWEHVVPASLFGKTFSAWTQGDPKCQTSSGKIYKGRRCAERVSKVFRLMQADLYNLYPSIGEVNNLRGNLPFGIIPGEKREFGRCDFEIAKGVVEVKEEVRGDIARTYFYMNDAYPQQVEINPSTRELFELWNREDPVDSRECERAKEIESFQKNENPFIKEECLKLAIW